MLTKRLILTTQYYDPEIFQVNHFVALLLSKGWNIVVIAPAPSYPSHVIFRNSSNAKYTHPNLSVIRFPTFKRNGSYLSVFLNSLLFVIIGSLLTLLYSLRFPAARLFSVQYSPISCIIPSFLVSFLLRRSFSLWVFDLWPQSISIYLSKSFVLRFIYSIINSLVSLVYHYSSLVFVSSPSFSRFLPASVLSKVKVLHSWEPLLISPRFSSSPATYSSIKLASIGNIGAAHDIKALKCLITFTSKFNLTWTFVGGGSGMAVLNDFCVINKFTHVHFTGFLKKEDCLSLCRDSDFSIVPFLQSDIANTICYRFVSSLSVGTPILSFGDNSVSKLVAEHGCGLVYHPSESSLLPNLDSCSHFSSHSSLFEYIFSNIPRIRSDFRQSAFKLFEASFSLSAAQSVISESFSLDLNK